MPVKRGVQLRRCSLCGKSGHNAARCLLSLKKVQEQKMAQTKENIKLSRPVKAILVKTFHSHFQSPHVVDLKKPENKKIWSEVPVFSEARKEKEKRVVADLAALVREANAKGNVECRIRNVELKKSVAVKKKINIKKILTKYEKNISDSFVAFERFITHHLSLITYRLSFFSYKRFAYSLLAVLLLAALPFPAVGYYRSVKDTSARVVGESANAFLALQSSTMAAFQADLGRAQTDLNAALKSFGQVDEVLKNEHQILQYMAGFLPIVGAEVEGREHLLKAGHHLALGNTYLLKGAAEAEKADAALTERFAVLANHLQSAIPQYREALAQLGAVENKILPAQYQRPFADFKFLFAALIDDLNDLAELSRAVGSVFGGDGLRRYLLVFQNNAELRPTGGFMGSFAVMDIQKGKIINLEIPGGGTYDLQGQLDEFVKPPLPLQLANKRWEFQDANWFPDFAASAQKMEWFYEHGRQTTVDGVIAINATVLERLLTVFGPVGSVANNLELTAANALPALQYQVEKDYNKEEKRPKAALGELATQFLEKFKNIDAVNAVWLLTELHEALKQKEIQVYFNDPPVQERFRQFGWTGEILPTSGTQDYLAVVAANVQGQKSDAKIKQVIEHQAAVLADGSVIDTVVVHRRHLGTLGEEFYGAPNISYLRVYVPAGAELLDAGGFNYPPEEAFKAPEKWYQNDVDLERNEEEVKIDAKSGTRITREFNKTVFGNWFIVNPGQAGSIYFTYRLPFKLNMGSEPAQGWQGKLASLARLDSRLARLAAAAVGRPKNGSHYSLLAQKQSGIESDFSSRIIYPAAWRPIWRSDEAMVLAANGAEYFALLNEDKTFGMAMERNGN